MTRPVAAASFALVAAVALAASGASAQSLGLGRRLGQPLPEAPPERATEAPAQPDGEDAERPWPGPQIQLGYEHYRLSDGYGGGDTHSATVGVFLQWPVTELRTALFAGLGGRDYSLGGEDLVVRGSAEIGFQLTELLDPFVPHVSLVVSFGGVVGQRFDTTVTHGFGGAGLELGASLRLVRNLHLAASFGYQRLEMDGAAFDLFLLRLGFGL